MSDLPSNTSQRITQLFRHSIVLAASEFTYDNRRAMTRRGIALAVARVAAVTFAVLLGAWGSVQAQTMRPPSAQPTPPNQKDDEPVDFGARENDARMKLVLKAEKKAYEEHVARAKEARDLAEELKRTFDTAKIFNAADQKKLERLEKLTRRIRNEVGGSQTDADPKDLPRTFAEGTVQLVSMTKELCEQVEKTPRRVVSTSIIDQANKLIALIQYLRGSRD